MLPWLIGIFQAVPALLPEVLLCAAVGLIFVGLTRSQPPALSVAALALSDTHVYLAGVRLSLESILDMVLDRSRSIGMLIRVGVIGITAGVLLTLFLSSWRRIVGPCFALIVIAGALLALEAGFRVGPMRVTEQLADVVDHAIQHYHTDHQSYPRTLAELRSHYLFVVPRPVFASEDTWCYDSGADYYRLGYLSHVNSPNDLILLTSAGVPPSGQWRCKAASP